MWAIRLSLGASKAPTAARATSGGIGSDQGDDAETLLGWVRRAQDGGHGVASALRTTQDDPVALYREPRGTTVGTRRDHTYDDARPTVRTGRHSREKTVRETSPDADAAVSGAESDERAGGV